MTLDQEDVAAIATEVIRQLSIQPIAEALAPILGPMLRAQEPVKMDAEYLASLPLAERKRRSQTEWAAQKAAMNSKGEKVTTQPK